MIATQAPRIADMRHASLPVNLRTSLRLELIDDDEDGPRKERKGLTPEDDPKYSNIKHKYFHRLNLAAPRAGKSNPVVCRTAHYEGLVNPSSSTPSLHRTSQYVDSNFGLITSNSPPIDIPSASKPLERIPGPLLTSSLPMGTPPQDSPPKWHFLGNEDPDLQDRKNARARALQGHEEFEDELQFPMPSWKPPTYISTDHSHPKPFQADYAVSGLTPSHLHPEDELFSEDEGDYFEQVPTTSERVRFEDYFNNKDNNPPRFRLGN